MNISGLILILAPSLLWASGYSKPNETFFIFLAYGMGSSILIYAVLGLILVLFRKLKTLIMVPVFLVLIGAAAMTYVEVEMIQIVGGFPGGLLIGALISTGGFIYLVNNLCGSVDDNTIE